METRLKESSQGWGKSPSDIDRVNSMRDSCGKMLNNCFNFLLELLFKIL